VTSLSYIFHTIQPTHASITIYVQD